MTDLNHDELYKKYLRNSYGPNVFPLVKTIVVLCAYFLIIILLMMNMFVVNNTKFVDPNKFEMVTEPEPLPTPIVSISPRK